jgi:hypothetical protein
MKKYFLKSNGQEIKLGQKIELSVPVETSYGKGTATTKLVVTDETLIQLIEDGFVVEKDSLKSARKEIMPCLKPLSAKVNLSTIHTSMLCEILYDMSPKTHLQLLIEGIATTKNKGKHIKDNTVYCMTPFDVFHVVAVDYSPKIAKSAVVFYDQKDAIEAYHMLSPFINNLHG